MRPGADGGEAALKSGGERRGELTSVAWKLPGLDSNQD